MAVKKARRSSRALGAHRQGGVVTGSGGVGMMVFVTQATWAADLAATVATGSTWIRMDIPAGIYGTLVGSVFTRSASWQSFYISACQQAKNAGLKICLDMAFSFQNDTWTEAQFNTNNSAYWSAVSQDIGSYVDLWQVYNEHDGRDYRNNTPVTLNTAYTDRFRVTLAAARAALQLYSDAPLTTTTFGYPINEARYTIWQNFFDGVSPSLDVIGVHAYPEKAAATIDLVRVFLNRLSVRYSKPVCVLEYGLPGVASYGTYAQIGQAIVDQTAAIMAASPRPLCATLYQLRDRGTDILDGEMVFGLLTNTYVKKSYYDPVVAEVKKQNGAAYSGVVRIMPLGDSITYGLNGTSAKGGYRQGLRNLLLAKYPNRIDMVGSVSTFPTEDPEHEGHSGQVLDFLTAGIAGWLNSYDPHIILLYMGTNDIFNNLSVPAIVTNFNELLDAIYATKPGVRVALANMIPYQHNGVWNDATWQGLHDSIPSIVSNYTAQGRSIWFVDMASAGVTVGAPDINDGTHPVDSGFVKMAATWDPVVSAMIDDMSGSPIAGSTLPVTVSRTATGLSNAPVGSGTYASTIAGLGAELYLTLDNTSGTVSPDSSGHALNGTLSGTYTLAVSSGMADGTKATAFTPGGFGQVSVPHAAPLNLSTASTARWSIVFRLKPTSIPGGWPGLMFKGNAGAVNGGWGLYLSSPQGGVVYKAQGSTYGSDQGDTTKAAQVGVWAHWALVWNGTDLRFYKDGALCPSATVSPSANTPVNTTALIINKLDQWGDNVLDEVSIHSTALTAQNIVNLAAAQLP